MKYLALGDSYTFGEGVKQCQTFPYLLQQFLLDCNIKLDLKVIAKTGWTVQELIEAINRVELKREYDFVTLLIGVNNQYRKHNFKDFTKGFERILNESISKSIAGEMNVFVLSIPNYGLTPFGNDNKELITEDIFKYNLHIRHRCEIYGVNYVEISDFYNSNAHSAVVEDGLHPSSAIYLDWARNLELKVINNLIM